MTEKAFESHVLQSSKGIRVDLYLAKRFKYFSRQKWQVLIKEKRILIDGQHISPSFKLKGLENLSYLPSPIQEFTVNTILDVLYEDESFLAINKPAPCPTTQTGSYLYNTVESLVSKYLNGENGKQFWMLHRLDIETSGVLLIAKEKQLATLLYKQFENHQINKTYHCVTKSNFPAPIHFYQASPIGLCENSDIRIKSGVRFKAPTKSALTYFTTEKSESPYHLIRCRLFTGRTNQIRVHLSALGHWIVGDKLYFRDESLFDRYHLKSMTYEDHQSLESSRMLLHASKVQFKHPVMQKELCISADLSNDFLKILR
jgi:RluA family pseudouridine synthase